MPILALAAGRFIRLKAAAPSTLVGAIVRLSTLAMAGRAGRLSILAGAIGGAVRILATVRREAGPVMLAGGQCLAANALTTSYPCRKAGLRSPLT